MRCSFYCTTDAYRIGDLATALGARDQLETKIYGEVIHVRQEIDKDNYGDWFCFSYGCIVFWGFEFEFEKKLIDSLKDFAINPLPEIIEDSCRYEFSGETIVKEEDDEILLESDDPLIKLSLSYGMSQSVKLILFEEAINKTISNTKFLPNELANKGKISLSRKKIAQQIGALFAQRNSINLHSDILDTPEFFWKRPRYEPLYHMAVTYLDITTRIDILNRKLDVIHELYDMLSDELKHAHSSFLEWVIILLIVSEVIMTCLKDILHWI
jgi:uncharacterized Rmd1/YagE family protein